MVTFATLVGAVKNEVIKENLLAKYNGNVRAAKYAVRLDALLEGYFEKMKNDVLDELLDQLDERIKLGKENLDSASAIMQAIRDVRNKNRK